MNQDELLNLSAVAAAKLMRNGDLSAETYADVLLKRCAKLKDLNAFITIDENAVRAAARQADALRKSGKPLGPLHGVPMAVKDNIDVAGLPATAGTPALANNIPTKNASIVERLLAAGAIVIGKANMHELAAGITTSNARFGIAHNPYNPAYVPGGSSGGTGAAVGARMAPCGLGTDTGGSNRIPPAYCGVVGFRPSTGRWSQDGLIANSTTRDTAGPMAHTVEDCALMDAIVTGVSPEIPPLGHKEFRLGVPRAGFWSDLDSETARVTEACLARLRDAGVALVDVDAEKVFELNDRASLPIAMREHETALAAYLLAAGSALQPMEIFAMVESPDVKAFLGGHVGKITDEQYRRALDVDRPALQAVYDDCFNSNGIDALIFPTSPVLPPRIGSGQTMTLNGKTVTTLFTVVRNTNPASIAGIPGLSLPAGMSSDGLPIGIELDGPLNGDRRLLAIGAAIEPLLPKIPPPPC